MRSWRTDAFELTSRMDSTGQSPQSSQKSEVLSSIKRSDAPSPSTNPPQSFGDEGGSRVERPLCSSPRTERSQSFERSDAPSPSTNPSQSFDGARMSRGERPMDSSPSTPPGSSPVNQMPTVSRGEGRVNRSSTPSPDTQPQLPQSESEPRSDTSDDNDELSKAGGSQSSSDLATRKALSERGDTMGYEKGKIIAHHLRVVSADALQEEPEQGREEKQKHQEQQKQWEWEWEGKGGRKRKRSSS